MTILDKMAIQRVDPVLMTTVRTILMSIMLIILTFSLKRINISSVLAMQSKDWLFIALAAVASSVSWLFYFTAFKYGAVSKVISIDRLSFVFIMFISAFFLGEPLTKGMLAGAALMVAGVMLIIHG